MGYKAGMLRWQLQQSRRRRPRPLLPSTRAEGVTSSGILRGWAGSPSTACDAVSGLVCNTIGAYEPAVGNPPGSISARMSVLLNLGGTFEGTTTWTSPAFTVPAGQAVTGATFAYDRQLTAGGLLSLAPESAVTVKLVDQAGGDVTLLGETLTTADSTFTTKGVGAPAGAVVDGHTYRLLITTETTTQTASLGITGQENTRFDNVVLAVEQSGSGGGGGGGGTEEGGTTPVVSPGVTVVRSFLSTTDIAALFRRFDESTLVGHGPGGSLIPRDLCTVIGRARADRIIGTTGDDVICGLGGNDVIAGGGGIDIIDGANGNDRLTGGSGGDKLMGLRGNDKLNGNAGNDRVGGGAGKDVIRGAAGKDRLSARDRRRDVVDGGKGRDRATIDRLARGARRTKAALRRTDQVRRVEARSS
jgi:Ca2+-binding RTX toxin-like protein